MSNNGKVFRIRLSTDGPGALGLPVVAGPALEARLIDHQGGEAAGVLVVELVLATDWTRPVADLRWQVDQVVRKVRRLVDLRQARCEVAAGPSPVTGETMSTAAVPYPVVAAVTLDLRRAFANAGPLSAEDERYAATEAVFRRWVNEDPAVRTSLAICAEVMELAGERERGEVVCEVLDETQLAALGMNLLLAVGKASEVSPPRLAVARWLPAGAQDEPPIMLLGKGITFDTGGINIKPYESFVSHMRNDMAGAALVFAAFSHLVEAGFPRPLVMVIPTCENAVGENAMRPGTVVKSHRGLRVKIDHTDAEGRLILADGLSYAEDRFAPAVTLCFATLTTAALMAYGPYATPVHFAEPEVEVALAEAAAQTGEDLHFFPRRAWHFEANRDEEADLKNTARLPGYMPTAAGSRNAGHFLLHFARRPLVHSDIFASTWNWGGDHPGTGFGATGAPLRTFLLALERLGAG